MKLSHLSDDILDQEMCALVKTEREVLSKILHHLREVEKRRLFSKFKFQSLFEYAIKRLGYSEDQAARRISAMRLLRELPQIEAKIESGALTLTHLVKAQTLFRQEKKAEVPRTQNEKLELLSRIESTSKRQTEATLQTESFVFQKLGIESAKASAISIEQFEPRLQEKLRRLMNLWAHKAPQMNLHDLIEQLADLGLEKWDPVKKAERSVRRNTVRNEKPQSPAPVRVIAPELGPQSSSRVASATKTISASRIIPSTLRHAVYLRDKGICQSCGSNRATEIDHKLPFAKGGTNELSNLRLLCRNCNQRHAIESYGLNRMESFLRSPIADYH